MIPDNVRLVYLPPYSPELNPQENVWDDMREKWFQNTVFNSLETVQQQLTKACSHYMQNPKTIHSITSWDWII